MPVCMRGRINIARELRELDVSTERASDKSLADEAFAGTDDIPIRQERWSIAAESPADYFSGYYSQTANDSVSIRHLHAFFVSNAPRWTFDRFRSMISDQPTCLHRRACGNRDPGLDAAFNVKVPSVHFHRR